MDTSAYAKGDSNMHYSPARHAVLVVGAILLIATLACGIIPGGSGDAEESMEVAPEPAEEVAEEPAPEEKVPPTATTAAPVALATGTYIANGTNPDGSTYDGTLQITRAGDVYEFTWEAGYVFVGEGIQRGDKVAVAYPDDSCQVALYDIGPEGTLTGDWVGEAGTGLGTEVATPTGSVSGGAVEGTYTYAGTAPDGGSYEGTMTIDASGDLYTVVQEETGTGNQYISVGITLGQSLAMSYGPEETCGVVLYTIRADGSLDGVWGTFGVSSQAGTELATPQ